MTELYPIDPARLAFETGDVSESYSGDRIAGGSPIRSPFEHSGYLWVCVSISGKGLTITGEHEFQAYRIVPPQMFKEKPTTYSVKTSINGGDMARADPLGFYHGMVVVCGGKKFVMQGPPGTFIAGPERPLDPDPQPAQLDLFP
jgi:hypothetical protein